MQNDPATGVCHHHLHELPEALLTLEESVTLDPACARAKARLPVVRAALETANA